MLDQVKLDEHPAFADLGTGYLASLGFLLQSDRMNLEQLGGLFEGEGTRRGDLLAGARDSRLALTRSKVNEKSIRY